MRTMTMLMLLGAVMGCDEEGEVRAEPEAVEADEATGVELPAATGDAAAFHEDLGRTIEAQVLPAMATIPQERRRTLDRLATFVGESDPAALTFICTHNSRRSHLAEQWASVAARYYGLERVATYSGGTEATAFNPRAIAALERAGFEISSPEGDNPRHEVSVGPGLTRVAFSKTFADEANPSEGFAAVMTCSDADRSCPFVEGAALRVALPYVDPKEADDTPAEASRYDERSRQIASEMFYLMARAAEASS